MKKHKEAISKRKEILTKARESSWKITPSEGIPQYKAEQDPHCPNARIRKFNEDKRVLAKENSQKEKNSGDWIKSVLTSNNDLIKPNVGVIKPKEFTAIAKGKSKESMAEVEILQKIIVRENFLQELHKLMKEKSEISSVIGEINELVKALRHQTLDIIEDIGAWRDVQNTQRPFLFKGLNYLVKIKCDLDFLDLYEEVIEHFCFEFKSNPLAYRGGGNVIVGYNTNTSVYQKGLVNSYYDSVEANFVDGIEIIRLHQAEKVIQDEFNRLAKEKGSGGSGDNYITQMINQIEVNNNSSNNSNLFGNSNSNHSGGFQAFQNSNSLESLQSAKSSEEYGGGAFPIEKREKRPKSSSGMKRNKSLDRISQLSEEAGELKAMLAHIEDQVSVMVSDHKQLVHKKKAYEEKMRECLQYGKEAAAHHITAEISILVANMQEINLKIKDLQRESYFIELERKRKLGVMNKLKQEIKETKRKEILKRKIEAKIKKEGLVAVLQAFNNKAGVDQIHEILNNDKSSAAITMGTSSNNNNNKLSPIKLSPPKDKSTNATSNNGNIGSNVNVTDNNIDKEIAVMKEKKTKKKAGSMPTKLRNMTLSQNTLDNNNDDDDNVVYDNSEINLNSSLNESFGYDNNDSNNNNNSNSNAQSIEYYDGDLNDNNDYYDNNNTNHVEYDDLGDVNENMGDEEDEGLDDNDNIDNNVDFESENIMNDELNRSLNDDENEYVRKLLNNENNTIAYDGIERNPSEIQEYSVQYDQQQQLQADYSSSQYDNNSNNKNNYSYLNNNDNDNVVNNNDDYNDKNDESNIEEDTNQYLQENNNYYGSGRYSSSNTNNDFNNNHTTTIRFTLPPDIVVDDDNNQQQEQQQHYHNQQYYNNNEDHDGYHSNYYEYSSYEENTDNEAELFAGLNNKPKNSNNSNYTSNQHYQDNNNNHNSQYQIDSANISPSNLSYTSDGHGDDLNMSYLSDGDGGFGHSINNNSHNHHHSNGHSNHFYISDDEDMLSQSNNSTMLIYSPSKQNTSMLNTIDEKIMDNNNTSTSLSYVEGGESTYEDLDYPLENVPVNNDNANDGVNNYNEEEGVDNVIHNNDQQEEEEEEPNESEYPVGAAYAAVKSRKQQIV